MTNDEFIYWLKGFSELSKNKVLDKKKIWIINNHANLVIAVEGKLNPEVKNILKQLKINLCISEISYTY